MNTIIGGLLVLSMLSKSSAIDVHLAAYDVFRTKEQIIYVIKKDDEPLEIKSEDIFEAMDEITKESHNLNTLLQEKNNVVSKVETKMDLKAYTKTPLSAEQIGQFTMFNRSCVNTDKELNELFDAIEAERKLTGVTNKILDNDMDMDYIYEELNTISGFQQRAINSLKNFLTLGNQTLAIL